VTQIALPQAPVPVKLAGAMVNVVDPVPPRASVTVTVACPAIVPLGVPLIRPPPIPVDIDMPSGNAPVNA